MRARVIWYFRRLRAMSPMEILSRLGRICRTYGQRRIYGRGRYTALTDPVLRGMGSVCQAAMLRPCLWIDGATRARMLDLFSSCQEKTLQAAEAVCRGEWPLLGIGNVGFSNGVDWHAGVLTAESWPMKPLDKIDLERGAEKIGDVRLTWEINRHHHLVTLAKAFYLSGDHKYYQELRSQFYDWIHRNPVGVGVNWGSAMELAIRALSWLWISQFIAERADDDLRRDLLLGIYEHCRHVERNLSLYSSANNHLLIEVTALGITGICCPQFDRAAKWVRICCERLCEEIPRQVSADGVSREQALHYQAFVMEALFILHAVAERHGIALPDEVADYLRRMSEFLASLIDLNGNVPRIGDSDDGHVLNLEGPSFNIYRHVLNMAAIAFDNAEFKAAAGLLDEQSLWLTGERGLARYEALRKSGGLVASRTFAEGGYSILRYRNGEQERILCFDHGPLGYGSLAAHGHADALSVTLSINGRPAIVDPGTYLYHSPDCWRDFFRHTAQHNTFTVVGRDQSEIRGPFLWGRRAASLLIASNLDVDLDRVSAQHDGYGSTIHRRTVIYLKPDLWIIGDCFSGDTPGPCIGALHLAKDITVTRVGPNEVRLSTPGSDILYVVIVTDDRSSQVEINESWASERYGEKHTIPVLNFSCRQHIFTFISINKPIEVVNADDNAVIFTFANISYRVDSNGIISLTF